tara:strand:+ start:359 stop:562 length:204 start_codon:yes stop_codon:yes gene_type:complete
MLLVVVVEVVQVTHLLKVVMEVVEEVDLLQVLQDQEQMLVHQAQQIEALVVEVEEMVLTQAVLVEKV